MESTRSLKLICNGVCTREPVLLHTYLGFLWFSMRDYALAAIAGIWLADGGSLLVEPRFMVERLREVIRQQPGIWTWQWLSVVAGAVLLTAALPLMYQPLWIVTALIMLTKGVFLALGPETWRSRVVEWCLNREDVDYRFVGIGLCTLAALLLHALGWLGQS